MSATFSEFFVVEKDTPKFTACISILLFRELRQVELIDAKEVAVKKCCWNPEYNVPNKYTPDTNPPDINPPDINPDDNKRHCMYRIYRYTFNYPSQFRFKRIWTKNLCDAADCTGKFDPNEVHSSIIDCSKKYLRRHPIDPQKSVM